MGRYSIVVVLSVPLAIACARTTIGGNGETGGVACETDLDCPSRERCDSKRCVPVPEDGAGGASGHGPRSTGGSGITGNGGTSGGGTGNVTTTSGGYGGSSSDGSIDASAGGASDASAGGARDASAGGSSGNTSTGGAPEASAGDAPDGSADGARDSSADTGAIGHDAADSTLQVTCAPPGSDYFVDPVGGSDAVGTGSGVSTGGIPTAACAFHTMTRAIAVLPPTPLPGTRIVVIGPSEVSWDEVFPIKVPENVVIATQGGDVSMPSSRYIYTQFRLAHPNSGIRGTAGATLTIGSNMIAGIEVLAGTDDTTFIENIVVRDSTNVGIAVNPSARLTIGEGVTVTQNETGMVVGGHVTISVPMGHRTTSFTNSFFDRIVPPPARGIGIDVGGSITIAGVPGTTPGTGTIVVAGNAGAGILIRQGHVAAPTQNMIDGLVVFGNGVPYLPNDPVNNGMVIGGGSNVKLRNSVLLGNGAAGVLVATGRGSDGSRVNDLSQIDLGSTGPLSDGGVDNGHNVFQADPGQGANGGAGLCLFVDPGSGTLNAAGNVFSGPRDCSGASPGALTFSNLCDAYADLAIGTLVDSGLVADGGVRGSDINTANCTH